MLHRITHHLVVAKLKLKLRKNETGQQRRRARYNADFLRDVSTAERLRVTLSNRYKSYRSCKRMMRV